MEYTIKIEDKNVYDSLVKFLKSIGIKILSAEKQYEVKIAGISLLSEKALADEWSSKEDENWDKVL